VRLSEPLGKPSPDDEAAMSWRVPGPGGHVRHFLARRTIEDYLSGAETQVVDAPPSSSARGSTVSACVRARACEEALPEGVVLGEGGEGLGCPARSAVAFQPRRDGLLDRLRRCFLQLPEGQRSLYLPTLALGDWLAAAPGDRSEQRRELGELCRAGVDGWTVARGLSPAMRARALSPRWEPRLSSA
jgi:hypothetical protein